MRRIPIPGKSTGLFVLLFVTCMASPAFSQWSIDPTTNLPVCIAQNSQNQPQVVSDGSGGVIIVWHDNRSSTNDFLGDIYAQRINRSGIPVWQKGGIVVCSARGDQGYPVVVSDDAGGAIVAWQDTRSDTNMNEINVYSWGDIYAQRIDSAGHLMWANNGIPVCTAPWGQFSPAIARDGEGGAIIAWQDERSIGPDNPGGLVYAQRVSASGMVVWTKDGIPVCPASRWQSSPQIVSDGENGAIVAWLDLRNDSLSYDGYDIYGQRIGTSGQLLWGNAGVVITAAANTQYNFKMVPDNHGGAILAWEDDHIDTRIGPTGWDIYAQRVNSEGQIMWSYGPLPVCQATGDQHDPALAPDSSGGAVVAWEDARYDSMGTGVYLVYAQKINSGGKFEWARNGIRVCSAYCAQLSPSVVSDGAGGAVISWADGRRLEGSDIYAQRVNDAGSKLWAKEGVPVSISGGVVWPVTAAIGAGASVMVWADYRGTYPDIYAQLVGPHGFLGLPGPVLEGVADVPGDQGGKVTISWDASPYDTHSKQTITGYSVWRGINPVLPLSPPVSASNPSGRNLSRTRGTARGKIYRTLKINGVETTWEWLADVPSHYLTRYSYTAATTSDSTSAGPSYFKFFVSAETSDPFVFWDSNVDSGYSVDNLAPLAPANVGGTFAPGKVVLHWNRNTEKDLYGYKIFRSTIADFNPDTMATYGSTGDTVFVDSKLPSKGEEYYAVEAVDLHGNRSPESNVVAMTVTGVKGTGFVPKVFALMQNYPNPFNPTTTIMYDVPVESRVSLAIYDMLGEKVATLVDGDRSPGEFRAIFDGAGLASGVYIYRLIATKKDGHRFVSVKKLLLMK